MTVVLTAPVAADPDRLAQFLANLIENAITYAKTVVAVGVTSYPDAGRRARSRSTTTDRASRKRISTRVFERFYRADRGPNRRLGSGLGLAIVAELAAAMGGIGSGRIAARPLRRFMFRGVAGILARRCPRLVLGLDPAHTSGSRRNSCTLLLHIRDDVCVWDRCVNTADVIGRTPISSMGSRTV